MSDEEFNLGTVFETVAAAIPEREAIVWGDVRLSFAELPTGPGASPRSCTPGASAPTAERDGLAGHESAPGPPGAVPLQRQRVRRGHDRVLHGPGGAVQRQLPLRGGGIAATSSPTPGPGPSSTTPPSPRCWPGCCRRCPSSSVLLQVADESGHALLPGAVDYEEALASSRARGPPGDAHPRRPLHPLHRGHHRHAQGRAVAPARHLPRRHGGPHLRHVGAGRELRAPGGPHPPHPRHQGDVDPAPHARRGPVGVLLLHDHGGHHGLPHQHPGRRPRRRVGHRGAENG